MKAIRNMCYLKIHEIIYRWHSKLLVSDVGEKYFYRNIVNVNDDVINDNLFGNDLFGDDIFGDDLFGNDIFGYSSVSVDSIGYDPFLCYISLTSPHNCAKTVHFRSEAEVMNPVRSSLREYHTQNVSHIFGCVI